MSEGVAYKRIRAARVARRFPIVLAAIADGRLHLDGVKLLAKYLTTRNAPELVEAATHRSSREIELLIAERFPIPDMPTVVRPLLPSVAAPSPGDTGAQLEPPPAARELDVMQSSELSARTVVPVRTLESAQERESVSNIEAHPRVAPISPGRFALQVTMSQHTHDLLRRAQELLAQAQPGCDIAEILDRALQELVHRLEHRRFGDTDAPRVRRASSDGRYIPSEIRRQVAERDGKRCTFVSGTGTRCPERAFLEYDHVEPVARGGRSTLSNLRLRCRAHNQYEAEEIYGEAFMDMKRGAGPGMRKPAPLARHGLRLS